MYGYSGGAIATGHAAELKGTYAPELNIVGAAEGGVPADLGMTLNVANGQATSGLILAAVMGLTHEYPEFGRFVDDAYGPVGQRPDHCSERAVRAVRQFAAAVPESQRHAAGSGRSPAAARGRRCARQDWMGKSVPDMPMYIWQGNPDEIIPVGQVNNLVDDYCRSPSATVQYTREHFAEHVAMDTAVAGRRNCGCADRLNGVLGSAGVSHRRCGLATAGPRWFPDARRHLRRDLRLVLRQTDRREIVR